MQTGVASQPDCSKNDNGYTGCGCTSEIDDSKSLCPNVGCGVQLNSKTSFGKGFNENNGGTYACELTPEGAITIWFFQAGTEPKDLLEDNPNPDTWPSTNRTKFNPCPGHFANLAMTLNTTLCGDWAGATKVFKNPTQPNCAEYIRTADLTNAYWSIEYIKVFKRSDATDIPPSTPPPDLAPTNCYPLGADPYGDDPKCEKTQCCGDLKLCFNPGPNNYTCQNGPCASSIPLPSCSKVLPCKNPLCM